MTKRSQTSGDPADKPGAKTPATTPRRTPAATPTPPGTLRERRSRAEREAAIQRYVILGTAIAAAFVVVVLVIAVIVDVFVTPGQAVAAVNGDQITVAEYQQRVRVERALINERLNSVIRDAAAFGPQAEQYLQLIFQQPPYSTWYSEIQVSDQLGNRVLNDMIDDELVRAEAAELGITITDADVQTEIRDFFGFVPDVETGLAGAEATAEATEAVPTATPIPFVSPTPSPVPTATPTPELSPTPSSTPFPTVSLEPTLNPTERAEEFQTTIDEAFNAISAAAGVNRDVVTEYFRTKALREAVARATLADTVQTTTTEADVRHILVQTEAEADSILEALEEGAPFADLARSVSLDTGSAANGGEYPWAPITNYVGPFADAIETAEIGAFAGPVSTEFGFHIIQVRGKRQIDMSDDQLDTAYEDALSEWLDTERTVEGITVETFPIWTSVVPSEPAFRATG